MNPTITAVRIVGTAGETFHVATNAVRLAFPDALLTRVDQLAEIGVQEFAPGTEVLVLLAPTGQDLTEVTKAVDARGWPRWAVVACTTASAPTGSHVVTVAPEDWNASTLRLAFQAAVRLQTFKSSNTQLAGDMRTISRRMGHDMRSPLNAILTSSEAMLEPDEDPTSRRGVFAESIATSVSEVVRLFERMNLVLKATISQPARQAVIMEEVVWGALQRLESRLLQQGATVAKPPRWPTVEGVPAWLDAVWTDLLVNALQHGGAQPRLEVGWEKLPKDYRFWVRNAGPTTPPKHEHHLFYPFDRLSELNAPRGLGLPTVRRLVELQGGRYGHEREPDGSWSFYFTLPASEPDAAS